MQSSVAPKSEARIQQDAFTEIRNRYPQTYGCLFHIPNGGLRDQVTATFMRGAGVVRGVQDLCFLWAGKVYFIEVKASTGTCSTDQRLIHAVHALQGFTTWIFTCSNDIVRFVSTIIESGEIGQFAMFISPYSRSEMVGVYRDELRTERLKKLKRVA